MSESQRSPNFLGPTRDETVALNGVAEWMPYYFTLCGLTDTKLESFRQAIIFSSFGRFDEAEIKFTELKDLWSTNPYIAIGRASMYFLQGLNRKKHNALLQVKRLDGTETTPTESSANIWDLLDIMIAKSAMESEGKARPAMKVVLPVMQRLSKKSSSYYETIEVRPPMFSLLLNMKISDANLQTRMLQYSVNMRKRISTNSVFVSS